MASSTGPIHIAVIGGTGLQVLPGFAVVETLDINTPWGKPSAPITILSHGELRVAFLSRHGLHHELAPHEVPARANIAALRSIGVRCVIAYSAVGSLHADVKPRDFVVPDQIIDRTKGIRPFTFFEGGFVGHVGFADPFDATLAALIAKCSASIEGVSLHSKGTIICMEGPQFSTRAESNIYRAWGGTVINMSVLPEAKLAREAEMAYQMVCMSTDYDCWHEATEPVTVEMVMGNMKANADNARKLLVGILEELGKEENVAVREGQAWVGSTKMGATTAVEGRSKEALAKLEFLLPGYFT